MAFSATPRPRPVPVGMQRALRLSQTCKAAAWWMVFLGLLYLLLGDRTSHWLGLRFMTIAAPLLRSLGLCFLLLGIYLRRSLNEPEHQYMAVDLLTLFFWAQVIVTTSTRITGQAIFGGEWLIFAVNLAFGIALIVLRTKSSKMPEGSLEGKDVKVAARETITRLKELLEEKKRLNPIVPDAAPPAAPKAPRPPADPDHKPLSEASPHMD